MISVGVGSFPEMSFDLHPSSPVANAGGSLRGTVVFINTDVMDVVKMKTALRMKRNEWFTSPVALLSLFLCKIHTKGEITLYSLILLTFLTTSKL